MVEFLIYCLICYFMAGIAATVTNHMPWFMLLTAPMSVPITICFIYSKALDKAFGEG